MPGDIFSGPRLTLCKQRNFSFDESALLWRVIFLFTPFFLYKHEGKFTPASIMLSFLRISGSNYAYDMLRENFENKNIKIKKPIFCLSFEE